MQRGFAPIVILVGVLILALGIAGGYLVGKGNISLPETGKACTLEAMICPDGSSVGRSGPNCEFAPCPSIKPSATASSSTDVFFKPEYETLKPSPNGQLKVGQYMLGDSSIIDILDKDGKIIMENILEKNYSKMGYNTKFGCQCGTHFKDWVDNTTFTLRILNSLDEEFEYKVDATTGLVDEGSFRKVN